jgi:uncharacterized RDD family membrane protein YckC
MTAINYGTLLNRVKAVIIDGLVLMGLGLLASSILSKFENAPDWIRLVAFIFVFLLYDPLFTSLFGGTIGHFFIGLRVRRESDESKKILLPVAIIRFVIKAFLGSISLLTVSGNKKNRAIHDALVGSVVIQVE